MSFCAWIFFPDFWQSKFIINFHTDFYSYSIVFQTHFILPEYTMQKDQTLSIDDAKDKLKQAGVAEDEMAALERQLAPTANKDNNRKVVGFVSAGVDSQPEEGMKTKPIANNEDIELPEESDTDEEEGGEKVEIAQKDVPSAVFGGLAQKRDESEKDTDGDANAKDKDGESRLGALERIKRQKRA